jgi:DNA-binding NarL/FixJ family response regulator
MKKVIQRDDPKSGPNEPDSLPIEMKRRKEIDVDALHADEHDTPADVLRMQLALMMGAWQSELSSRIDGVLRQIERSGEADEHWEILRRQMATSQSETARYVAASISSLTKTESKIFLLTGMCVPQHEIADILNIPVARVSGHQARIYRKLHLAPDTRLDELFNAMLG